MYIFINTFYKKYILNKELVNACRQKKFNNIIFFVKQGADINLVVNEFGDSILHVLAQNDQTEIYTALVNLGADQNDLAGLTRSRLCVIIGLIKEQSWPENDFQQKRLFST